MIEVSENLKNLASIITNAGHKVYVVGGFVRNSLLGLHINDVDLAGSMLALDVMELAKKNGYGANTVNKKLGTVLITKDDEQYEYTTFRQEVYDDAGTHKPEEVAFVADPKIDAKRRDFTINAFYFDIMENKVYDFFNGEKDLKKKLLRTVVKPETVFTDDGLRILRLIRFVCELGFKPESNTIKTAKKYAFKVAGISKERILREIKISVNGGLKYHLKNTTHGLLVKYYNNLNLWQYIFGSNFKDFKIKPHGKLYRAYIKSDGSFRYIAFMCLLLNNYIKGKTSKSNAFYSVNQLLGVNGLKESNKNMQDVLNAYLFVQKFLYYNENDLLDSYSCIEFENLPFEIKNYLTVLDENKSNKLKLTIMHLKKSKVPFEEDELNVLNTELINDLKIKPEHVSKIKSSLFEMCVKGLIINDHEILLEQAKFLNEKLLKLLHGSKQKDNK